MWNLSLPWWEFAVRALIVYALVLVLLRLSGKRQVGQMTTFDLVLLILIGNGVQNAMNGGDNSVGAGFILAGTLLVANLAVSRLTRRSRSFENFIEGEPALLIHNGRLHEDTMRRCGMTHGDLMAALREAGCASIQDVHAAVLETTGKVSVLQRKA